MTMYAATANGAVAGAAAMTTQNVAVNAANTTGTTTTMMSDDDLRALTDDAHTIRCCDCEEMIYDDGRYDCRCTQGDTNG